MHQIQKTLHYINDFAGVLHIDSEKLASIEANFRQHDIFGEQIITIVITSSENQSLESIGKKYIKKNKIGIDGDGVVLLISHREKKLKIILGTSDIIMFQQHDVISIEKQLQKILDKGDYSGLLNAWKKLALQYKATEKNFSKDEQNRLDAEVNNLPYRNIVSIIYGLIPPTGFFMAHYFISNKVQFKPIQIPSYIGAIIFIYFFCLFLYSLITSAYQFDKILFFGCGGTLIGGIAYLKHLYKKKVHPEKMIMMTGIICIIFLGIIFGRLGYIEIMDPVKASQMR